LYILEDKLLEELTAPAFHFRVFWSITAVLVLASLFGCSNIPETEDAMQTSDIFVVSTPSPEIQPTDVPVPIETPKATPFPVMPGGALEAALNGAYAGTTVVVGGSFTDIDGVKFRRSMKAFEEATGITVKYIGGPDFTDSIGAQVAIGNGPDIVDFRQPSLLADLVRQGYIIDPTIFIDEEWLKKQYNQSWLDMSMTDGQSAGVWHRFNGKSLVWYPKDDFEAAGYEIPTTWDEMMGLMDAIVAAGDTPWCIGIESGSATGWPATDWVEDFMLRTTSLENYDRWTTGELAFASSEVKHAAETMAEIWFNDSYVYGGTTGIASTFFGDSPAPMFENPPQCWLHKQSNFITGYFPEGATAGVDYGFFYLPGIDEAYGKPFLVTGDIMAMFDDRPEVRALMEYFTIPESVLGWLEMGGALAAHQTVTPAMYGVELEQGMAELVADATSFRFDGSQLMPEIVGSGSFEKGMTDWVAGSADLNTILTEIDAPWP
jgi:alpha-glucoside transport system substrate-binding protein